MTVGESTSILAQLLVAFAEGDDFVIIWKQGYSQRRGELVARRWVDGGWLELELLTPTDRAPWTADLSSDEQGLVALVWIDQNPVDYPRRVHAATWWHGERTDREFDTGAFPVDAVATVKSGRATMLATSTTTWPEGTYFGANFEQGAWTLTGTAPQPPNWRGTAVGVNGAGEIRYWWTEHEGGIGGMSRTLETPDPFASPSNSVVLDQTRDTFLWFVASNGNGRHLLVLLSFPDTIIRRFDRTGEFTERLNMLRARRALVSPSGAAWLLLDELEPPQRPLAAFCPWR